MERSSGERKIGDSVRKRAEGRAFRLYGVVRTRHWPGGRSVGADDARLLRVQHRDLEALVRAVPFEMPPLDRDRLREHQSVVEQAMQRGTILPAPYGVVFRNRRTLVRFLQDQYLALDEGLSFLEGHWELRLHLTASNPNQPDADIGTVAMSIYSELRQFARAAIPFPRQDGGRVLSAAFLVERKTWIQFVERTDDVGSAYPQLTLDVTGPWPPYDFVKMVG